MSQRYAIERYRKDSDRPEAVTDVTAVGGETLARIFDGPLDAFVDGYAIEESHAQDLTALTGITFDLDRYEYFLDVTAE